LWKGAPFPNLSPGRIFTLIIPVSLVEFGDPFGDLFQASGVEYGVFLREEAEAAPRAIPFELSQL
jgi:hypothetical protein